MFSSIEKDILNVNRAVIDLHGFFIISTNYNIIHNPKILVTLLTEKELTAFLGLDNIQPIEKLDIEEAVIKHSVLQIVDQTGELISIDYTPAGIISYIAEAVIAKSTQYLTDPVGMFAVASDSVTFFQTMIAIISYYTNTPYDVVKEYPVNQIFSRYAICQNAFPTQINPITKTE
jgi:hypothetical protein